MSNKFDIKLLEIHWISEDNAETDLCAHGQVKVKIGDEIIVDRADTGSWTVSATAQLLLRTLERNHTKEDSVGDQLVPCCGHFLVFEADIKEVYIAGCPSGFDWEVRHENGLIKLTSENGTTAIIDFNEYKTKVLTFVDEVEIFYIASKLKQLPSDDHDRNAYLQFWKEWHEKRNKWA